MKQAHTRYLIEFFGSFFLYTLLSAGCIIAHKNGTGLPLYIGQAISGGIIVFFLLGIFAVRSRAFFHPALVFGAFIRGLLTPFETVVYSLLQVGAGLLSFVTILIFFGKSQFTSIGLPANMFHTTDMNSTILAMIFIGICTFFLMIVYLLKEDKKLFVLSLLSISLIYAFSLITNSGINPLRFGFLLMFEKAININTFFHFLLSSYIGALAGVLFHHFIIKKQIVSDN